MCKKCHESHQSQKIFVSLQAKSITGYGREDFSRFNLSEHAGLCKGGTPLIGTSIIACYASASLRASSNAEGREGSPANWEIDEQ